MSDYAIEVSHLGKCFLLGQRGLSRGLHQAYEEALRQVVAWLKGGRRMDDDSKKVLWALRDVNLKIRHGEIVGLVGHNGAGKSVLLKILSRITSPTEGYALVAGKVGSMLEVGAGFHPEFTGRENLFLAGAILGMEPAEIRAKFDDIVAFAEVEGMLDTPVKRYSSGMYVRLAFSVAAHLDANIMLFDEVIAVGDVNFREKCLQRIKEMADEGRTVIFVSHNLETLREICPRTIVMNHGHIQHDGPTAAILESYQHPA
jgi:lipopolysaccharide transport system ATP-binding protein